TGIPISDDLFSSQPGAGSAAVEVVEPEERAETPAGRSADDLSVRLRLSKLDDLVNLFGELLINRSVLEERIDRLNQIVGETVRVSEHLRDVGEELGSSFETPMLANGQPPAGYLGPGQGNGMGGRAPGMGNGFGGNMGNM